MKELLIVFVVLLLVLIIISALGGSVRCTNYVNSDNFISPSYPIASSLKPLPQLTTSLPTQIDFVNLAKDVKSTVTPTVIEMETKKDRYEEDDKVIIDFNEVKRVSSPHFDNVVGFDGIVDYAKISS